MAEYIREENFQMKDLSFRLTQAVEQFERHYKDTLNSAEIDIDENTYNVLYSLGADIKHLFDEVINILAEN